MMNENKPATLFIILTSLLLAFYSPARADSQSPDHKPVVATFSVAALDPENGDLGVAVQSKFFNAAAIVPWAKAGVGAVATQAFANYNFGPEGLRLLESGLTAQEALKKLIEADEGRDSRQLSIVDAKGNVAHHTGPKCTPWAGAKAGKNYVASGNILVGEEVVLAMARAFENTAGELADRLMAALEAGQAAGGDARGMQSAGLLVVRKGAGFGGSDRYIDLRVDDNPEPIKELKRLLARYRIVLHLYRASLLENQNKIDEAIREAKSAADKDPAYADAHYRLATLYARTGKKGLALQELREALRLNPLLKKLAKLDPKLADIKNEAEFKRSIR